MGISGPGNGELFVFAFAFGVVVSAGFKNASKLPLLKDDDADLPMIMPAVIVITSFITCFLILCKEVALFVVVVDGGGGVDVDEGAVVFRRDFTSRIARRAMKKRTAPIK